MRKESTMNENTTLKLSELSYDNIMSAPQYYIEYFLAHDDMDSQIASLRYGPLLCYDMIAETEGAIFALDRLINMYSYQYKNHLMRFIFINAIMYGISVEKAGNDREKIKALLQLVPFTEDTHETEEKSLFQSTLHTQLTSMIRSLGPDYQKIEESAMLNYAPIVSFDPKIMKPQAIEEMIPDAEETRTSFRSIIINLLLNYTQQIIEGAKANYVMDGPDDVSFPHNIIDLTLASVEAEPEIGYFVYSFALYKYFNLIELGRKTDAELFNKKFMDIVSVIRSPETTAVEGVMKALDIEMQDTELVVVDKLALLFEKWNEFTK